MSGLSVAKKVNKAMTKVGKKLGFQCTVYRPDSYSNPFQDKNILSENMIAFSVDQAFVRNPVDDLTHMIVYAASSVVRVGDIIVCNEPQTTIVVDSLDPIRAPSGILANERMNLFRSVLTPLADKKTSLQQLGELIPCAVRFGSTGVNLVNAGMASGKSTVEVWTWMPVPFIEYNDVIDIRGNRYSISAFSSTEKGTQITATSIAAGK